MPFSLLPSSNHLRRALHSYLHKFKRGKEKSDRERRQKASSMANIEITGKLRACKLAGEFELYFPKPKEASSSSLSLSLTMHILRKHRTLEFKNLLLRRFLQFQSFRIPFFLFFPLSFLFSIYCSQYQFVAPTPRDSHICSY